MTRSAVFAPFEIVEGSRKRGLVLVADHAGRELPDEYGDLGLPATEFERHIAYDIGVEAVTRKLAAALDAPAVMANFSRLLIDPNRGEEDPTLIRQLYDGTVVPGTPGSERAPSSDTAAHAYVYRHMPDVGGVVHTHSTYATAWAARGEAIPCVLTMIADEFGGDIPVGPFALIGDDSIGRGIVETLQHSNSRAVLMRNHGPFTVGRDARDAVKAAVMVEDVARTVHISRQLGTPDVIPPADVRRLFDRYQNVYGQPQASQEG